MFEKCYIFVITMVDKAHFLTINLLETQNFDYNVAPVT